LKEFIVVDYLLTKKIAKWSRDYGYLTRNSSGNCDFGPPHK